VTINKNIEVEIKIEINNRQAIQKKILDNGFKVVSPYCFEHNVLLDTPEKKLKNNHLLLRIRKIDRRSILTFKRPPAKELNSTRYKVREELEVDVTDFDTAITIFKGLGFEIFFIYEKYREIYDNGIIKIMLDQTPIGDYMEIEGAAPDIDRMAAFFMPAYRQCICKKTCS